MPVALKSWRLPIATSQKKTRHNTEITAPTVRVIGIEGEQVGVMSREEALALAAGASLDLVEISPNAVPPVVRIMDFGKHLFELKKKSTGGKQKKMQVKEVKFRPSTEDADYQVKLRNILRFLSDGNKAKITLRFRGREMAHVDVGRRLLDRLTADLAAHSVLEQKPILDGRQMTMMVGAKH